MTTIAELKKLVHEAVLQQTPPGVDPYWEPLAINARLGEEAGEVGRELLHHEQVKPIKNVPNDNRDRIENEAGDVIFTLICLSNKMDLNLERGIQNAIQKCWGRDKDRFMRPTT